MNTLTKAKEILGRETTKEENTLFALMAEDGNYTMYKNSSGVLAFILTSEIGKIKARSEQYDKLYNAMGELYQRLDDEGNEEGLDQVGELAATFLGYM